MKNKTLLNWLGILGVISFISYLTAVIFSPLAYTDYNWLSQAVSDLSADNAPSLRLWKILSTPYQAFNLVSVIIASVVINKTNNNKLLKIGVYLFAVMNLVSSIGYGMFPLSDSGENKLQDTMHIIVTVLVVLLSIVSLVLIIIGGARKNGNKLLFISAIVCLSLMMIGAIGTGCAPKTIFGLFERFSTLSAVAFVAVLGIWVFNTKDKSLEE